ncbi:glycoside hydrolase family 5 protein [Geodermatophilus sp. SYSU D00703]
MRSRTRRRPGRRRAGLVMVPLLFAGACTAEREREAEPGSFVRAEGNGLVLDGEPVRLQAVNFSNDYHRDLDASDLLDSPHHAEEDFARVAEMGFTDVRFAFDGDWYAQDREVFFEWLDRNLDWAREHGVRLVLDLHTPIGGFWLDPTSDAVSFDVWTDPEVREQNVAMWRDIAERYADDPTVAAYDLFNEPVTVDSDGQQWRDLAADLVGAVRAVDPNHLLVVGSLYGVDGRYGTDGLDPHFLVDDDNVVYDFHFYEPIDYTHQYAAWVEGPIQDGGAYPEPDTILPTGERVLLPGSGLATPPLAAGTTDWRLYDSGVVTIDAPAAVAAMPLVIAGGGMTGTAVFDAVTVTEHGPDGAVLREVVADPLDPDGTLDWYSWSSGGDGAATRFERLPAGVEDGASLAVADAPAGEEAVAGWSNDGHLFPVTPGNSYRVQGWMRGEGVGGAGAATIQLDVYGESPGAAGGGFLGRDRAYLEHAMEQHLRFGRENDVPMSVMEFGVVRQAFEVPGKGGDRWVADMLALLEENDLSFAYWEYHGSQMGIHLTSEGPPGEPNTALRDVLERELA